MANSLDAAMRAYDKLKIDREHGDDGIPVDLDEDDVLTYALIGIGQELAIANGLALAALLAPGSAERDALIAIAKSAIGH